MITTRLAAEKGSSFKRALTKLKVSEEIEISDVDGDFIVEDPNTSCVFLAGGIGVTPFHSILKQADHEGVQLNVVMLYANRDENVPYKEEFDQFAERNPRLVIHYLTSPERIDETSIKKYAPDLAQPTFYVSGPEPMVESLGTMLKSLGVPPEHLKQDWFPGYPAE